MGGGGGGARGRHRNDFFPITFIVHNQKSNGGANGRARGANEGGMAPRFPLPGVTPLPVRLEGCSICLFT